MNSRTSGRAASRCSSKIDRISGAGDSSCDCTSILMTANVSIVCGLAVFLDPELVLLQIEERLALTIRDDDVDADEVDARPDPWRWLLLILGLGLLTGRRRLLRRCSLTRRGARYRESRGNQAGAE